MLSPPSYRPLSARARLGNSATLVTIRRIAFAIPQLAKDGIPVYAVDVQSTLRHSRAILRSVRALQFDVYQRAVRSFAQ